MRINWNSIGERSESLKGLATMAHACLFLPLRWPSYNTCRFFFLCLPVKCGSRTPLYPKLLKTGKTTQSPATS